MPASGASNRPGGTAVKLDAAGSSDPDGDRLSYSWFPYPEAGNYRGEVRLEGGSAGASPSRAIVHVPADAAGKEIHVIVAVTDSGQPPLTRYRRVVITAHDSADARRTIAP